MVEIKLTKCLSCKKCYKHEFMKAIILQTPLEESYVKNTRFLCPECYANLERNNWVKEQNLKESMEKKAEEEQKEKDR